MLANQGRTIKSDETLLDIIDTLRSSYRVGVTDIANQVDMSKSVVHRHLNTLQQNGFVVKEDSKYRLSLWFLDLGTHVREEHGLYRAAKSVLDDLMEETDLRVWCLVEEHGQGVIIYNNSPKPYSPSPPRMGIRMHLHHTAAGKATLAFLSPGKRDAIIDHHGLPQVSSHTITDRSQLESDLQKVRERGYALNFEEYGREFQGVGVPLYDKTDSVIGGISVTGPKGLLDGDYHRDDLPDKLRATSNEIKLNQLYGPLAD